MTREIPIWREPIPEKIDTEHCLGCGSEVPDYVRDRQYPQLATPDGRPYYVCRGRANWDASDKCLRLALARIHNAKICAGCGGTAADSQYVHRAKTSGLCCDCRDLLRRAATLDEELRNAKAATLVEARDKLVDDFLRDVTQSLYRSEYNEPVWGVLAAELCETDDLVKRKRSPRGRLFDALRDLFGQAIVEAHARGMEQGSSLLRSMNDGRLALHDFDRRKGELLSKQREKVRYLKREHYEDPFDPRELFEPPKEDEIEPDEDDENEDDE